MTKRHAYQLGLVALSLMILAVAAIQPAAAKTIKRSLCIYDPLGANGPVYNSFEPYLIQAREWGINFKPIPYTEEAVAASDFKSGKCDAMAITGLRAIHFVKFSGSFDMAGGLQNYKQVRIAMKVMSSPKAAKYMTTEKYETVGVVPLGKAFLFSRNKEWLQSLDKLAGHKIAVMSYDKQSVVLAKIAGLSTVPASIATFGPMFNNGSVDLAYAPAFAFEALELYKGLKPGGGIADFVLGMLSGQVIVHKDRFPDEFGQKSRTWVYKHMFDSTLNRIKQSEESIPDKFWVHINDKRTKKYYEMFRKVRQRLWEQNWYSHRMQKLLKRIRCKTNPSLAECTMDTEGGPAL